jgi:hypothetical protein
MIDREFLESRPNLIAAFERTRRADGIVCLMRSRPGGYYWHAPDYTGLFAWGATADFHFGAFRDALARGLLRLIAGEIPADLKGDEA